MVRCHSADVGLQAVRTTLVVATRRYVTLPDGPEAATVIGLIVLLLPAWSWGQAVLVFRQ